MNLYLPLLLPSTARPAARFATVDRLVAGEEHSDIAGRRRERVLSAGGAGGLTSAFMGESGQLFGDNQQAARSRIGKLAELTWIVWTERRCYEDRPARPLEKVAS